MTATPAKYGLLELSPWARRVIPEEDRQALRRRVKAYQTLWLSTSNDRVFLGRLTDRNGSTDARGTLEQVLDALLGPVA